MIKHNLISLVTHCLNVANISTVIARQHAEDVKTQQATWQFGFAHDAGWLNLETIGTHPTQYKQDNATIEALNSLKELANIEIAEEWRPLKGRFNVNDELLVKFAKLHAEQHSKKKRERARNEIRRLLVEAKYNPSILNYVCWADGLSTARETPGDVGRKPRILHTYSTPLNRDIQNNHFNAMRRLIHVELLKSFYDLLTKIGSDIASILKLPFNPVISANLQGVEYVLDVETNRELMENYGRWLYGKVQGAVSVGVYTAQEMCDTLLSKPYLGRNVCIFCNSPSKYVKNLHQINRIFAGKKTKITPSFWTNRVQGSERTYGICPPCLYVATQTAFTRKPRIAIGMPRIDALLVRKERLRDLLAIWRKLADEGRCKPDPIVYDLKTWSALSNFQITKYYEDLDSRRETYEYVKRLYDKVVSVLGQRLGEEKVADGGMMAMVDGRLSEVARALRGMNYPLILVNSLKTVNDVNTVVLGSYPLREEKGLVAAEILGTIIENGDAAELLSGSRDAAQFLAELERTREINEIVKRRMMPIIIENFEIFEEVFEEVKMQVEALR